MAGTGRVGLLVHSSATVSEAYLVSYDVALSTLELVRYKLEPGILYRMPRVAHVLSRQPLARTPGTRDPLEIVAFTSAGIIEVFVDRRAVLTTRVADLAGSRCGLFTEDCPAVFKECRAGE